MVNKYFKEDTTYIPLKINPLGCFFPSFTSFNFTLNYFMLLKKENIATSFIMT